MPDLSLFLYSYGLGAILIIGMNLAMNKKSKEGNKFMPLSKEINELRVTNESLTETQKKRTVIIFNTVMIAGFLALPFYLASQ